MLKSAGNNPAGSNKGQATMNEQVAAEEEVQAVQKPSSAAIKRIAADFDFSKPLIWHDAEDMAQWYALVQKPPLHSVVVDLGPDMAKQILLVANTNNRHLGIRHSTRIGKAIKVGDYELTGDTIKFSKTTGRLLDGQHRLDGCIREKKSIRTHMVFGLEDNVFDVIDQGKRRSAGDILGLTGIEYSAMVAAMVSWVMWYQDGGKRSDESRTTRKIKEAALGRMKDITQWTRLASQIRLSYKHPASIVGGILYLIGQHDKALAEEFARAWLHGPFTGRNRIFEVLSTRFMQIKHQSQGHINNVVRAALIIQTFNHWNAGVVASPKSLSYKKEHVFPSLEFDASKFNKGRAAPAQLSSSLVGLQTRILEVMIDKAEGTQVSITQADLSEASGVPISQMTFLLRTMVEAKQIDVVKVGHGLQPTIYKILL